MPPPRHARTTKFSEADLTFLKRHHRNIRQHVRSRLIPKVLQHPDIGEPLEDEYEGVFCVHFWKDRYRFAYALDDSDPEAPALIILAVGLKDGFYDDLARRLAALRGDEPDE